MKSPETAEKREKRRMDRVRLYAPISAEIDTTRVLLIDLNSLGARVEHPMPLHVGSDVDLSVHFESEEATVRCQVVRCRLDRSSMRDAIVYDTGLRFSDPEDPSVQIVDRIIRKVVSVDLKARRAYVKK